MVARHSHRIREDIRHWLKSSVLSCKHFSSRFLSLSSFLLFFSLLEKNWLGKKRNRSSADRGNWLVLARAFFATRSLLQRTDRPIRTNDHPAFYCCEGKSWIADVWPTICFVEPKILRCKDDSFPSFFPYIRVICEMSEFDSLSWSLFRVLLIFRNLFHPEGSCCVYNGEVKNRTETRGRIDLIEICCDDTIIQPTIVSKIYSALESFVRSKCFVYFLAYVKYVWNDTTVNFNSRRSTSTRVNLSNILCLILANSRRRLILSRPTLKTVLNLFNSGFYYETFSKGTVNFKGLTILLVETLLSLRASHLSSILNLCQFTPFSY